MDKREFSVREVAQLLNHSTQDIYALIRTQHLRATKSARGWRITDEALAEYLGTPPSSSTTRAAQSPAALSRRAFNALIGMFASGLVGWAIQDAVEERRLDNEANALFGAIFGLAGSHYDCSYGRPAYWGSFHPYNQMSGTLLQTALGLRRRNEAFLNAPYGVPRNFEGDLFVFGGPNSTLETAVAWGFVGENHRELVRESDPAIPLRWWGISAEADIEPRNSAPVTYGMGLGRMARTRNWPMWDAKDRAPRPAPTRGESREVEGETSYLPADNYLLITRLPNFIDPNFLQYAADTVPQLLVIEGTHGPGTLAAELLTRRAGLGALQELNEELRHQDATEAFQALFKVYDPAPTSNGFHRFRRIMLLDTHRLPRDPLFYRPVHLLPQVRALIRPNQT